MDTNDRSIMSKMTAAEPINNNDDDQQQQQRQQQMLQQQQQHQYLPQQIDVRMKRHPELQPFVPSDRDRFFANPRGPMNSGTGSSTNNRANNTYSKFSKDSKQAHIMTNSNDAKSPSTKPKKCVSMSRLDQLAQPKKLFTPRPPVLIKPFISSAHPASSLSSSHTTSTAASSLTSNKNFNPPKNNHINNFKQQKQPTNRLIKKDKEVVKRQSTPGRPQLIQSPQQNHTNGSHKKQVLQQEQQVEQGKKQRQHDEQPKPVEIRLSAAKPIEKRQSQQEVVAEQNQNQQVEEKNQSELIEEKPQQQNLLKPDVEATAEELSEMSLNDRHYQSAASDLIQDSESSIALSAKHPKTIGSLFDEIEAELLADGFKRPHVNDTTLSINRGDDGPQELSFIEWTPQMSALDTSMKPSKEDDEKRIRADEELRERARREEMERQNRKSIVDDILSRINSSS